MKSMRASGQGLTLEQALHQGLQALQQEDWKSAAAIYEYLATDRPDHPDVLYGLAQLAWTKGQKELAIETLKKACDKAPKFIPFWLKMGDWQIQLNKKDLAIGCWQQAKCLGAGLPVLMERIVKNKLEKHSPWTVALALRAKALEFVKLERWKDAFDAYGKLFSVSGYIPGPHELKEAGAIALNAKNYDFAEIWLNAAQEQLRNDSDISINLGNVAQYRKDYKKAEELYRSALKLNPSLPEPHNNLGVILKNSERYDEAEVHLREALSLRDAYPAAWNNLGLLLQLQGKLKEAEAALRRGLEILPEDIDLTMNLGAVLGQQGRKSEAEPYYKKAAELAPNNAIVLCNIGVSEFEKKNYSLAKDYYLKAMAADPAWMPARNNLAALYMEVGRHEEAIEVCKEILRIEPDYADALNNMGISYRQINRLGEAKEALEKCLGLKPDHKEALSNYAFVNQDLGNFDDALKLYEQTIKIDKKRKNAWDNYLFCANYHPDLSLGKHLAIYKRYDIEMGSVENPINANPIPINGRKLRIAYVSGDLRRHPQQYFIMPFIDNHDRSKFELWFYHDGVIEDEVSAEMKRKSDGWVRTRGMSSEEFARKIYQDNIDILIDLAGHTGGNRADVYPYKAAPIQLATLLGWNYGVGLSCMDALIGDYWTLPEGLEQFTIEPLLRVPCNTYVCRLDHNLPRLPQLPAKRRGYLTFGTTTRTVRLNDRDLGLWADLLKAVPGCHLHFNSRNFKDPASIDRMNDFFTRRGIEAERLEFDFTSPISRAFENIDVYLDTFPHNNGTTLIEALWFGLPVITKVDRPPFGCIGQSVLHHAGLHDLIAMTENEYIAIAQRLAADWGALEQRRITQRDIIAKTELFDEATSVRWFEQAYFAMYEKKLEESKQ